jgi:hypothetical protein
MVQSFRSVLVLFCGPGQLQDRLRLNQLSLIATSLRRRLWTGFHGVSHV